MALTGTHAGTSALIHTRTYTVRAYHDDPNTLRLRGAVLDLKPAGLYFDDDPEPLPVHEMVVDLILDFPSLEITDVDVVMEVTPHTICTNITTTYDQLIGLSIARGFSRQVKDRFGGPSGCTHIGALLQAMAPVAIQSMWSMRLVEPEESPLGRTPLEESPEARREAMKFNLNTCHVWEENTHLAQLALEGKDIGVPVWAEERLLKLGKSPDEWDSW